MPLHPMWKPFFNLGTVTAPSTIFEIPDEEPDPEEYPPLLYRYLGCDYALEALQKRKWKVGKVTKLNDPLDCSPKLINTDFFLGGGPDFEERFLKSFADNFGLLCYSKKIDSPVLWSHYADIHRGIALGFTYSHETWKPAKVKYLPDRPIIDCRELDAKAGRTPDIGLNLTIRRGYSTKAEDWRYEEEYRHFISLKECQMEGSHYFRDIPLEDLREVVLGVNCMVNEKDIENILSSAPLSHSVKICRCRKNRDQFRLVVETILTISPNRPIST